MRSVPVSTWSDEVERGTEGNFTVSATPVEPVKLTVVIFGGSHNGRNGGGVVGRVKIRAVPVPTWFGEVRKSTTRTSALPTAPHHSPHC